MNLFRIFTICLFYCHTSWAQSEGGKPIRIYDRDTHLPVPYATIKSISSPTGTYTNEKGDFELTEVKGDTILISSIGYIKRIIATHAIQNDTILLDPHPRELETVTIGKRKKITADTLGIRDVPELLTFGSDLYTYEMAQKIKLSKGKDQKAYELKKVFIGAAGFAEAVPVLLHIYSLGANGFPDKDLLSTKILLRKRDFDKKRREFIIDLQNEHIVLTDSAFFIGLEWLPVTVVPGHIPPTIRLRLTDAIPEMFTYSKGEFVRKKGEINYRHDNNWRISYMVFPPSTTFLKRKQIYGTNAMISIEADVLE